MYILAHQFFKDMMRQFFFNIDKIVFGLISKIYDLLLTIARVSPLSQGDITNMADRIYRLLAIFMIFKVTFSLIMYVVNPDDFTEKSKGVGNLTKNIILSLALLILTPFIFRYAYQFQEMILESNSLAALVFGDEKAKSGFFNTAGEDMAYTAISPFFVPDTSINKLYNCTTLVVNGKFNPECSGLKSGDEGYGVDASADSDTLYALTQSNGKENDNFRLTTLKNYVAGVDNTSMGLMFRSDMALATFKDGSETRYVMDYSYFVSTAVGVVIVLLLVSFCMDIGVRSIKLAFLQLIAPIPIISYVDPKSGKDGLFKKWYKMCLSTFLSLFIRLIVIYFAVYIISKVANHKLVDVIDGSYVTSPMVSLFILIGALMFAKQFPKILENLGLKLDGGGKFTLNPLKKFEEEALGGKRLTGAAGALVSGVADRAARIATAPGAKGKLAALAGAPTGLLGAAARGFASNQGYKGGKKAQSAVNRRLREGRIKGLSATSSYLDYLGSRYGLDDATLETESTITRMNRDKINEGKKRVEDLNRENTLRIEEKKKNEATRKTTQSGYKNVNSQSDRLLKHADDFASKKADLGVDPGDQAILDNLRLRQGSRLYNDVTMKDGTVFHAGDSIDDSMIARAIQSANSKQYTSNRRANEANVQNLINHNGEVLTSSFMIGNQLFGIGETIDGNMIARAQQAQEDYNKESAKEVFNEMAKGTHSAFYGNAADDVNSFTNIGNELLTAIDEANLSAEAYEKQYGKKISKIGTVKGSNGNISFDSVKKAKGETTSGQAVTEMNTAAARVQSEIERLERENENNRRSVTVEYRDEQGRKVTHEDGSNYTIEEAESHNKPREEKVKEEKERHNQRRAMLESFNGK